jgi:acetylornithine/N-succinyldiaminopimelate aminotransferase
MTETAMMPTYARIDLSFERGEGAYLFSTDGRRFLDFGSGIAVNALGHSHPHLVKVLQEQGAKLWHTSNLFRIPEGEKLAGRLCDASFADQVFFTNSGAEALECSIKVARKYQSHNGHPEKYRIICCNGSFHGRTLATIAAGGGEKLLAGFGPAVEGFDHVAFDNLNEMKAAITPETAAIMVEPVIGEGGIIPASHEYLKGLRETCDEFGLLLIFDEVQCGLGRTGKLFAHEWADVQPDIAASAKGIGGGFPLGACLATKEAAAGMVPGTHGSTYGGNPLATAVGNGVLDVVMAPGFLSSVIAISNYLNEALEKLTKRHSDKIDLVRGAGLMVGIKVAEAYPVGNVITALRENGLIAIPAAENTVRLLPPMIIEQSHVDEAAAILDKTFSELEG